MSSILDESLVDILSYCAIRDLPPKDDNENVWIKAVGLVAKSDGTHNYVAIQKDREGNNKIVLDTGNVSAIVKVEEIYPYLYLDANFVPTFKKQTKEERIKWLQYNEEDKDFSQMSLKELDREIILVAIAKNLKFVSQKYEQRDGEETEEEAGRC